mgnify:CR=1 FL=1
MKCGNCGYCDCMIVGGEFRPSVSKPKSFEDLIANLARRVTSLERKLSELEEQVDSNTKDIRTWSTDQENLAFKIVDVEQEIGELMDKIEMIIDDEAYLDERTQPLVDEGVSEFAAELADLIERKINESRRKGRI